MGDPCGFCKVFWNLAFFPWIKLSLNFSLAAAGFLAALDQTIVLTSMPTIASQFNLLDSQSCSWWYNTGFYLLIITLLTYRDCYFISCDLNSFPAFFGCATNLYGCKVTSHLIWCDFWSLTKWCTGYTYLRNHIVWIWLFDDCHSTEFYLVVLFQSSCW